MNYKRTSLFLTANLGSEIVRFVGALEKNERDLLKGSHIRALSILNELEVLPDMKTREGEILILRNVLNDMIHSGGKTHVTPRLLKEYFMPFAIRYMSTRSQ